MREPTRFADRVTLPGHEEGPPWYAGWTSLTRDRQRHRSHGPPVEPKPSVVQTGFLFRCVGSPEVGPL